MKTSEPDTQLDLLGVAALIVSAMLLYWAQSSYYPYSYFQIMRWIVSLTALFAGWRFAAHRWYIATALLIFSAILFNPVNPIRMARYQWHPIDLWNAVAFIVLAILLCLRTLRRPSETV